MKFNELKTDSSGLVPVITQDYNTGQVLMLAYMNEAAYKQTLETNLVTYYSRSRNELWVKGATSGHYQHVRTIYFDCDLDTLLIKVKQEGVACHEGTLTCFNNELDLESLSVLKLDQFKAPSIFQGVYDVVMDRKLNPKEGSYTNYLFDKGIDKILKKVGEETAEIIIGAKNEGKEEMVYEISDLLYHLIVLMVEKGATWEDIYKELDKRR